MPRFSETAHRYYGSHFRFVLSILESQGYRVNFYTPDIDEASNRTSFEIELGNQRILFDISDYHETITKQFALEYDAIFKFHYRRALHEGITNLYPFSPISFYDWTQFRRLRTEIHYFARGLILNKQTPHTQNFSRRTYVQRLLLDRFREGVDIEISPQEEFWRAVGNAAVAVFVPGARTDILDRGQLQYMAFGACTISPPLSIDLPYGRKLVPGEHYVPCNPDWSDLIAVIDDCLKNPLRCRQIGQCAKALFSLILTDSALSNWIDECLRQIK